MYTSILLWAREDNYPTYDTHSTSTDALTVALGHLDFPASPFDFESDRPPGMAGVFARIDEVPITDDPLPCGNIKVSEPLIKFICRKSGLGQRHASLAQTISGIRFAPHVMKTGKLFAANAKIAGWVGQPIDTYKRHLRTLWSRPFGLPFDFMTYRGRQGRRTTEFDVDRESLKLLVREPFVPIARWACALGWPWSMRYLYGRLLRMTGFMRWYSQWNKEDSREDLKHTAPLEINDLCLRGMAPRMCMDRHTLAKAFTRLAVAGVLQRHELPDGWRVQLRFKEAALTMGN